MRMRDLPLIGSVWPIFGIVAVYFAFVLKIGPAYMKNRPAYKLRDVLLIYNAFQVIGNFYYGIKGSLTLFYYWPYDIGCMLQLPEGHPKRDEEIWHSYVYLLFKILDLLDTAFFVLRKNYKQLTFLHTYHHAMILLATFMICYTEDYGGHNIPTGVINHFVHGVMYTYYFLSALSPQVKQSLWWKKYITIFQLVQFAVLLMHNTWPVILRKDCQFPFYLIYLSSMNCVLMLSLFSQFYYNSYVRNDVKNIGKVEANAERKAIDRTLNNSTKRHIH